MPKRLSQPAFSRRRISDVWTSAICDNECENNHQLDVDRLFVKEASVGKSIVMKRFRHGRGAGWQNHEAVSHLTVILRERGETE